MICLRAKSSPACASVCRQCVLALGQEEDMDWTGDECKYFSSALFIERVQPCDVK